MYVCGCVYVEVCGCLVSRKQRRVQGPLHSLPRDTHRSQHLDQTYTCTHTQTHKDVDAHSRHTQLTTSLCLSRIFSVSCSHTHFWLTHTSLPCIQIEYTQQSQCAAVALSLMYMACNTNTLSADNNVSRRFHCGKYGK